jgi:hypothetical protein
MLSMKPGDLVRMRGGSCYDFPVDHHEAVQAIRHFAGIVVEGASGVVLQVNPIFYADGTKVAGWCQVLMEGRAVWVLGTSLTKQYEAL